MWCLCCLLCVLAVGTAMADGVTHELRLLHVLYRHGARTPILWLPHDVNNARWALIGPGQLTNEGKRNQWELGSFLRHRYAHFLRPSYHANYTHVSSTDVDRTLMSAEVNLAALYPAAGGQLWLNSSQRWQPVPVHTRRRDRDLLLRFQDACAAFVAEQQVVLDSARMQRLDARLAPLYRFLSTHAGLPVASIEDASSVSDTLNIEHALNLSLPVWARSTLPELGNRSVFPQLLDWTADLSFQLLGWSERLRRLGGGQLLAEMMRQMMAAAEDQLHPASRQLFMYSAHDFNVAALLCALGVFNGIKPPLASCVMVELLHDLSHALPHSLDSFSVRVLYRNSTTHEPHVLMVPGCHAEPCPLARLLSVTRAVRPVDAAAECHVTSSHEALSRDALLVYLSGGGLLAAMIVVGVVLCRRRCRVTSSATSGDYQYTSLQQQTYSAA